MRINEIRKNVIQTSSKEYVDEISNYLFNGNFSSKSINDIGELFSCAINNKSKKNDEDFKFFYDKVAYVDFCKYNGLPHNGLAGKKYLAAAFNPITREFSYNSNKFYKDGNTVLNTILVLNVRGKEIYKVLTSIYTCLRDNEVDNCITIPSYNRFEEGLTDSIRININVADMERVVNLIDNLPLPIINLIDKPNMLYPRVNDYIGFDRYISPFSGLLDRASNQVCQALSYALFTTTIEFIERDGNEKIENGEETILEYRKKCLDEDKSLIDCDIKILQRMVSVDPSNKDIFIKNFTTALSENTRTKSAYISKEVNEEYDKLFGQLDDESILYDDSLEFNIKMPIVEVEGDLNKGTDLMVAADNDLLVQEEQTKDLMVQEEQSKDLMIQEEPQEESLYDSFMNRSGSSEEYLNSLLANAMGDGKKEEQVDDTSTAELLQVKEAATTGSQVGADAAEISGTSEQEHVHFYDNVSSVGTEYVVTSAPADTVQEQSSDFVRPEDMNEDQKKLVKDTFAEMHSKDSNLLDSLDAILNKLPENGSNIESIKPDDTLSSEEVQSLASNQLDEKMTYERALKYKDLVSSINILNIKIKGTDFTLLDYFDQQQLLDKIKPDGRYMIVTDEVYSGLEVVENCIIKYVTNYGNVPLDKIMEEWGIQELVQQEKKEKPKGLKGLFRRKRS